MKLKTLDEFMTVDMKDDLRDPEFALGYLQACLDEAKENNDARIFFSGVQYVAQANEISNDATDEIKTESKKPRRFAAKTNHSEVKRELVSV